MVSESRARISLLCMALAFGQASISRAEPNETQKTAARRLMDEGLARRNKGDHKGALESFRAAHALVRAPRTAVEIGRTLIDLGRLVEARAALLDVDAIPQSPDEPEPSLRARAEAKAIADDLAKRIPTLRIDISGAASAVEVSVDERDVTKSLGAPMALDPGEHRVRATMGKVERRSVVSLAERDHKSVTLDFAAPPEAPRAEEPPPRTLMWIGLATTGVGVVAGSVTGLLAFSRGRAAKEGCEGSRCPPSTHDDLDASRRFGTISNVSFAVAGVGAIMTVAGLVFAPSAPKSGGTQGSIRWSAWVGVASVGLAGRF